MSSGKLNACSMNGLLKLHLLLLKDVAGSLRVGSGVRSRTD